MVLPHVGTFIHMSRSQCAMQWTHNVCTYIVLYLQLVLKKFRKPCNMRFMSMKPLKSGVRNMLETGIGVQIFKWVCRTTSRKHCEKKPQSFSHCGFFDHHDMHSLDDCKFTFFWRCNTPLERYFSTGILEDPKFLTFLLVNKKQQITIFVNLGLFQHFETVTNIRTWIKSHRYWRML